MRFAWEVKLGSGLPLAPVCASLRVIAVAPDGAIYVTDDVANNEIFEVDPTTGNRSIVSGNGVGGTTFGGLKYGIAVYPSLSSFVPEPSSVVLFALGTAGLIVYRMAT